MVLTAVWSLLSKITPSTHSHWGGAFCTTVSQESKGNALLQQIHMSPALPTQTQRHIKTSSASQNMHSLGFKMNTDRTMDDSSLHPTNDILIILDIANVLGNAEMDRKH